jgi:hypothetical protein
MANSMVVFAFLLGLGGLFALRYLYNQNWKGFFKTFKA